VEDVLTFDGSSPQPDWSSAVVDKHAAACVDGDLVTSIVVVEITNRTKDQQQLSNTNFTSNPRHSSQQLEASTH